MAVGDGWGGAWIRKGPALGPRAAAASGRAVWGVQRPSANQLQPPNQPPPTATNQLPPINCDQSRSRARTLRSSLDEAGRISLSLYPLIAAAIASAMPVLPLVASMMVSPRRICPRCSAMLSMWSAGRSLAEPAGLVPSSLARTTLDVLPGRCCSRTIGVLPTRSATVGKRSRRSGRGARAGAGGGAATSRGRGGAAGRCGCCCCVCRCCCCWACAWGRGEGKRVGRASVRRGSKVGASSCCWFAESSEAAGARSCTLPRQRRPASP
jgi:hypothetical protein